MPIKQEGLPSFLEETQATLTLRNDWMNLAYTAAASLHSKWKEWKSMVVLPNQGSNLVFPEHKNVCLRPMFTHKILHACVVVWK